MFGALGQTRTGTPQGQDFHTTVFTTFLFCVWTIPLSS